MQTIWLGPTNFVTGDPTLRVSYPFVSHPSTIIGCTAPGDFKWVSMGLRLPPDVLIEELVISYQVSNARSFISQIRLAEMTTPDHATVIHDDPTHLTSTTPVTYNSAVSGRLPAGALTLELRLNFQNASDEILLGAVGIKVRTATECRAKSIAELRALQPGAVLCLIVLGYYAPGDGGGGQFYWDAVATESDNGGTIIVPVSNPPAGRWRRVVEGPMSVRWFGAKGDGVTPDQSAIEAAMTATAVAAISGEVFMPPGEYAISTTVTVTSPVNNITITGSGAVTKLLPKSRDFVALSASGLDEFHIRKLWIMAAKGDTSGSGVTLINCTNSSVRNCRISGFGVDAIYASGGANLLFDGNTIIGTSPNAGEPSGSGKNEYAIYCAAGAQNIRIISNDISGTGQGIGADQTIRRMLIEANTIHDLMRGDAGPEKNWQNGGQHGMYNAASELTVVGNTIYNVPLSGIKIFAGTGKSNQLSNQLSVVICGNTIDAGPGTPLGVSPPSGTPTNGWGAGIELDGPGGAFVLGDVNVSGNVVRNFFGYGISIDNSTSDVKISGNIIENNYNAGIIAQHSPSYLKVTSNQVARSVPASGNGIQVTGTEVHVGDCEVIGTPTGWSGIAVSAVKPGSVLRNRIVLTSGNAFAATGQTSDLYVFDNTSDTNAINVTVGSLFHGANSWDVGSSIYSGLRTGNLMSQALAAIAVTGANVGDSVLVGSEGFPAGVIFTGTVVTAGQVALTLFNGTGQTLNNASGTVRVNVSRRT
jgi:parallel beta-helix repeat protein